MGNTIQHLTLYTVCNLILIMDKIAYGDDLYFTDMQLSLQQ